MRVIKRILRSPDGWRLGEPRYLMGRRLRRTRSLMPNGYRLEMDDEGDAVEARVMTGSSELAARGRMGLSAVAVPDQIVTQTEHQRRGLGRVVMSALSNAALDRGRVDAVLLASEPGHALYSALGWRMLTPFREAVYSANSPLPASSSVQLRDKNQFTHALLSRSQSSRQCTVAETVEGACRVGSWRADGDVHRGSPMGGSRAVIAVGSVSQS
jgi:GNAT superfamily N-acetyltransferase